MVTPVVLTYNEEPNIQHSLTSLRWAPRVIVLDSGSTDRTSEIARSFQNVSWLVRPFDSHRSQWEHAIRNTGIDTEYVLALDADMCASDAFRSEIQSFMDDGSFVGAYIPFQYHVLGRPLAGSIYPPQLRLFRKNDVLIRQPGHTQIFEVSGPVYKFRSGLIHDDRKPLDRWLNNQVKYACLEAARIRSESRPRAKDLLRCFGISTFLSAVYAYLKAGGPLNSPASRAYACERIIFEALLTRILASSD